MASPNSILSVGGIAASGGVSPLVPPGDTPPPAETLTNDPITDIKLLASLPANLGQNMDLSA